MLTAGEPAFPLHVMVLDLITSNYVRSREDVTNFNDCSRLPCCPLHDVNLICSGKQKTKVNVLGKFEYSVCGFTFWVRSLESPLKGQGHN